MSDAMNPVRMPESTGFPVDSFNRSLKAQVKSGNELEKLIQGNRAEEANESMFNVESEDISAMGQALRRLKPAPKNAVDEVKKVFETKQKVFTRKEADDFADQFSRRDGTKEYHLDPLVLASLAYDIGDVFHEESDISDILDTVRERLENSDPAMIDKTLDFLIEFVRTQAETSVEKKPVLEKIAARLEAAKEEHYGTGTNAATIQITANIIGAVDAVAVETGAAVQDTLNRYRDIVHTPPDLQVLRKHYEKTGDVKSMNRELKALSTYISAHIKRTNDLENAELGQLGKAARLMQALLGVYKAANFECTRFLPGYIKANDLGEAH